MTEILLKVALNTITIIHLPHLSLMCSVEEGLARKLINH